MNRRHSERKMSTRDVLVILSDPDRPGIDPSRKLDACAEACKLLATHERVCITLRLVRDLLGEAAGAKTKVEALDGIARARAIVQPVVSAVVNTAYGVPRLVKAKVKAKERHFQMHRQKFERARNAIAIDNVASTD